jgi:hypothetical protein
MSGRKYYITLVPSGYGHYKIIARTRGGREYKSVTSNMPLVDRYNSLKVDRSRGILAVEGELASIARGPKTYKGI